MSDADCVYERTKAAVDDAYEKVSYFFLASSLVCPLCLTSGSRLELFFDCKIALRGYTFTIAFTTYLQDDSIMWGMARLDMVRSWSRIGK